MQITIQYRDDKKSKKGQPFLSIKDTQGKRYSVWESYLFHLFTVGATLDVIVTTKGEFTNITGVMGMDKPNESGGVTVASNGQNQSGIGILVEKLYTKINGLEGKIDEANKKLDDLLAWNGMKVTKEERPSLDEIPF